MEAAFDRYVLRTPMLPFEVLGTITTKEQLLAFFKQPEMREAIYLASPAFYEELLKDNPTDKVVYSLMKYLQRAATRCTPFAFFASCAVVETGRDNIPGTFRFTEKRHTRPDMDYLCALAQHIAADTGVREKLRYFPNTSLYKVGDKIRYTEFKFAGTIRQHQLTNVDQGEYLNLVLEAAESGKTIDALVTVITGDDISDEEARHFIIELIDAQLLVSSLDPTVTGEEYLDKLISELHLAGNHPRVEMYRSVLSRLREDLRIIDKKSGSTAITEYRKISEYLVPLGVAFDPKFLFQADVFRETDFIAPENIAGNVGQAINVLARLFPVYENADLNAFRDAFSARYEEREVPLTEAIDAETGLGYPYSDSKLHDPGPLLEGVTQGATTDSFLKLRWPPAYDLLLKKIVASQANGEQEIKITDDDLRDFAPMHGSLADTFPAMCSVTGYDRTNGSLQLFLNTAGDSSAVNLLGRFCHGEKKIDSLCREIAAYEESLNHDVLLAEIVHLPESRLGNVLFRPVLRKFEIPYLANSPLPAENQIELKDLMLSVRNGKLVLRSRKHNRMVVPRMGNAHNYSFRGLPFYVFLCDLQHHYAQSALSVDVEFFIQRIPFMPRIVYNNVILSPATWQFKKTDLEHLFQMRGEQLGRAIEEWRRKNRVPRYQLLPDNDNELFVDWENPLSAETLLDVLRKRDKFRFTEFLFDTGNPLLQNQAGFYTNQFIVCCKNRINRPLLTERVGFRPQETDDETQRTFQPGSEWLYFKIYTGIKTADRVLTELLLPFVQQLKSEGEIQTWFFIRYGDPRDHIRFRMRCNDRVHRSDILQRFHEALAPACENGLIAQVQLDTYQRELERYGNDTIEIAEQLFETDSELALRIISYLDGDYGDTVRWKIGLLIIDAYLKAFRLDAETIVAFTASHVAAFESEYNFGKDQRVQVDKSYREKRSAVEYVLKGEYSPDDECMPLYELVKEFGLQFHKQATAICEIAGAERTFALLPSFIHMSVNRLFRSRQRFHELMVYTFLNKYYTSMLARRKKTQSAEQKTHV